MEQPLEGNSAKKQLRWTKSMSRRLLGILAEEVKRGNRPNNTFRTSSFNLAARSISEEFGVKCLPDHVDNHLRTLRNSWTMICKLRGNSGFGWDDNLKMITASPKAYAAYITVHPAHDKYLNKKIDLYDELAIVVGKDMARGDCAKSFADIDLETHKDVDNMVDFEVSLGEEISVAEKQSVSSATSSATRKHRKRPRKDDATKADIGMVCAQLGEVATALKRFADNRLDVDKLYAEIMKVEGFEEVFPASAFDYLVEHEMRAKAFLAKGDALRKLWLVNFGKKNV